MKHWLKGCFIIHARVHLLFPTEWSWYSEGLEAFSTTTFFASFLSSSQVHFLSSKADSEFSIQHNTYFCTVSCHIKHGYDTEIKVPRLQMARENALSAFSFEQPECQRTPQMGQEEHYQWNSFTYLAIFFCTFLWRFNIHLSKKCFQDKCYNLKIITNRWWCLSNPGDKLTRALDWY